MKRVLVLTIAAAAAVGPLVSQAAASEEASREEVFLHALPDDIRHLMQRKKKQIGPLRPAQPVAAAPSRPATYPAPTTPVPSGPVCAPGTVPGTPVVVMPAIAPVQQAVAPAPSQVGPLMQQRGKILYSSDGTERFQILYSRDGTQRLQKLAPRAIRAPAGQVAPAPVIAPAPAPQPTMVTPCVPVETRPILAANTNFSSNPLDEARLIPAANATPDFDVPEPGTLGLLGMGLVALGLSRRRRRG